MEDKKKHYENVLVWLLFCLVLLIHIVLAKIWSDHYFIYYFNNCLVFLHATGKAYQNIALLGWPLDFFSRYSCLWGNGDGMGTYWPPLGPVISLITLQVLPLKWFFLQNIVYLALIMAGVYFSAKILLRNKFYGMLAAVIFSCYWVVTLQLVSCEIQLLGTVSLAWALYWYLRSCSFSILWPSVMVGVCMVIGLYSDRVLAGFFILALFLVPSNFKKARSVFHMSLVLLVVVWCVWPFYSRWLELHLNPANHQYNLFDQKSDNLRFIEAWIKIIQSPRFFWAHCTYYFVALTDKLLGYGFTGLLLVGIFGMRHLKQAYIRIIITAVVVPLIFLLIIPKKDFVYVFPLCMYAAIISSLGIFCIRLQWLRYCMILLVIALFAAQSYLFWLVPRDSSRILFSNMFHDIRQSPVPKLFVSPYPPPVPSRDKLFKVMAGLKEHINEDVCSDVQKCVLLVDVKHYSQQQALAFLANLQFKKVKIRNIFFPRESFNDQGSRAEIIYLLSDYPKYVGASPAFEVMDYAWRETELMYRFPDSRLILYRVKQ